MKPLTDTIPKPLLTVAGKPLVLYHIEKMVQAGVTQIIINHAWLGEQIKACLGNGHRWGACIDYSYEPQALETAGGIINALPLLGSEPFILVNGDVWSDYPFAKLRSIKPKSAHLVLAENPKQHPLGDFSLQDSKNKMGLLSEYGKTKYTYSGISVLNPSLFSEYTVEQLPLALLLRKAMATQQVTGELYSGDWVDVGTPERLTTLNERICNSVGD